jgi:NAD(P)-dependent dehydrogenase (short-subunit alcohol dehydrogenase family)
MNIIITGAGKGLGFALAQEFLKEPGHRVIALSRNIDALSRLSQSGPPGAMGLSALIPYRFDLRTGSYDDLFAFAELHFKQLDVLVNNAGLLIAKPFEQLDDHDFDAMFDTNVKAVARTIRTFLPMMHTGSHIVNISSMGGYQGSAKFPGLSLYSAGKGAVSVLTECLAEEFKDKGIRVNALALGSVQTEMLAEAFPGYTAALTAAQMAVFVKDFALRSGLVFNGKVLPVSQTTP